MLYHASWMSDPIVELRDVEFSYGKQAVLEKINLRVDAGTIVGVIGPNGGGKTTLMRLLLGLIKPDKGSITIDGLSPAAAVRRGNIVGYLPQQTPTLPNLPLSVRQVARLGLVGKTGLLRSIAKEDLAFADSLLERLELDGLADAPVRSLSGGGLQRLLIARALAPRPKLLLLDEPTVGIDQLGQRKFIDILQRFVSDMNLTVLFVSHDLQLVTQICGRLACLNRKLHVHEVPTSMNQELVEELFGVSPVSVP